MISIVATISGNYNDFFAISGTYTDLRCGSFPQWRPKVAGNCKTLITYGQCVRVGLVLATWIFGTTMTWYIK
jgi:hypothetical protein